MNDVFRPVRSGHVARSRSLLDRLGATGSLLCAIHCALLPLLIAALPSLGVATWLGDDFERGFVLFATMLGLFSVVWGYRRHGAVRALGLLLPGLAVLWMGVLYGPLHHALVPHALAMTLGGTLVGLAHMANLRLNHSHVHDASCVH
ncbi:MerC domain-containing protein [Lysobacter fragariae]